MKFHFDFENYRNNLADEIKEKKKISTEEAKDFLESEQKTEKYQISKLLKKEANFEIERFRNLEVETIDISEKIPENIQLWLDREKLKELGEYPDSLVGSSKNEIEEAKKFINDITDGDFLNPEKLNTIIYGYSDHGRHTTLVDFNPHDRLGKADPIWFAAGGSRFFRSISKRIVISDPFSQRFLDLVDSMGTSNITLNFTNYGDNLKRLGKNRIIKDERDHLFGFDHVSPNNDKLKKCIDFANKNKEEGLRIHFVDRYVDRRVKLKTKITWIDIADWIIDLPAGKLYKIKEIEKKSK